MNGWTDLGGWTRWRQFTHVFEVSGRDGGDAGMARGLLARRGQTYDQVSRIREKVLNHIPPIPLSLQMASCCVSLLLVHVSAYLS